MLVSLVTNKNWPVFKSWLALGSGYCSLECAKDSVTFFPLLLANSLQAIEIKSSLLVNLCISRTINSCGKTNIRSERDKVIAFPQRSRAAEGILLSSTEVGG